MRGAAIVRNLLLGALVSGAPATASDFWISKPYSEWTHEECQSLITRSTQRAFPWKKDLGRSGFTSRGAVVWYADTVWRAFFRYKEKSEQEMVEITAGCRPGLLLVLYFSDDPGGGAKPYHPSVSPGSLVDGTYLDNGQGERVTASAQAPGCLPFVDKFTIVFYFPIDRHLVGVLSHARSVSFACDPLGIRETFDLDDMRVHGVRDCYWKAGAPEPEPVRVVQRERPRIDPMPFKIFAHR